MAEIAGIITALAGLLAVLGGAIRWLWNKIDARFVEIETELAQCRERESANLERRAVHILVIELLWQEVKRLSPKASSQVLTRAKHLLDDLKAKAETLQ